MDGGEKKKKSGGDLTPGAKKLTMKQKLFCREYLVDFNLTQAAIRAGYSRLSARTSGQDNMQNPAILAELQRCLTARLRNAEISADAVLGELKKLGFADISDFLEVNENGVYIFNTADWDPTKTGAIESVAQTKDGIRIKLYDKVKSLELLGRYLKLFVELSENKNLNLNHHSGSVHLDITVLQAKETEELRAEVEALRAALDLADQALREMDAAPAPAPEI